MHVLQRFAVLAGLLLAPVLARAADGDRPAEPCLSSGDAQEVVGGHKVVTPAVAIVQAREVVPKNADVLRASLCREPDALVYRITILRKDGRLIRVTVDAPSGKVKTVH